MSFKAALDPFALSVGPTDGPALVFGNSLGTNSSIWDRQLAQLSSRFKVVRFEYPGHGGAPRGEPYRLGELARALVSNLEQRGIRAFSYCGISMGGAVGLELALAFPSRVASLVLCHTAARFGTPEFWQQRMEQASKDGLRSIAEATVSRWLTEEHAACHPGKVEMLRRIFESTDAQGYLQACRAVMQVDLRDRLKEVNVPTLIVAGSYDRATPPDQARELHALIRESQYVELPVAHLGHLEAPEAFDSALAHFLERLVPTNRSNHAGSGN